MLTPFLFCLLSLFCFLLSSAVLDLLLDSLAATPHGRFSCEPNNRFPPYRVAAASRGFSSLFSCLTLMRRGSSAMYDGVACFMLDFT
ncbi:hypothetical protein F5X96DRAFT_642637 [Biscogniauxia mediterranea]|nr:hypothetical protein F5X96DRAFT_642637 [Biscogniauxia mediterranea]